MRALAAIFGAALLFTTLLDVFETIILPKRAQRRFRITHFFYEWTWRPWAIATTQISSARRRETLLSFYGPLSLLLLFAVWAVAVIIAFALLDWAAALRITETPAAFPTDLFVSANAFFTLGALGANRAVSTVLDLAESAIGFAFLGLLVGYLPVLYQSFSRRERVITLLDASAGTPSSAAEFLGRQALAPSLIMSRLVEFEAWCSEVLESTLSYPVLAYFRSHHNNESWLDAVATMLDSCAVLSVTATSPELRRQAELTFAIARHTVVDIASIFETPPKECSTPRLTEEAWKHISGRLSSYPESFAIVADTRSRLDSLRDMYEPYVNALSQYFLMSLPHWTATRDRDNWQITAWNRSSARTAVSDAFTPSQSDD